LKLSLADYGETGVLFSWAFPEKISSNQLLVEIGGHTHTQPDECGGEKKIIYYCFGEY